MPAASITAINVPITSKANSNVPITKAGKWLRAGEIALKLGYTRQHMARLCRAQAIPGARATVGGHWRIQPTAAFNAWFKAQPRARGLVFVPGVSSEEIAQQIVDLFDVSVAIKTRLKQGRAELRRVLKEIKALLKRRTELRDC
ncbi:MAG: helix-turn-helix domain-containing protein [Undibacterium sp.]|nr:helix-turn-helix domain-containing protein [Opitutaceae bacterium]